MQISASVQGDIIKLPAGVHLPDGTPVCVVVDEVPGSLPPDYFKRVPGAVAGDPFKRPEQVTFERRTER